MKTEEKANEYPKNVNMKFILLTHERELSKGTNTGRLVKQILGDDVEIITWKRKVPDERLVHLLATKQAALLFPKQDSDLVNKDLKCFEYLVILDSTWQEARKMFNRSGYLNQAERVSLSITKPSEFKLRRNQIEGGLSTIECVIQILRQYNANEKVVLLEDLFLSFNQK
tara:strand:- start:11868 stop:12377 length:510 start_codon:yes stop_codon:yes gene_type:complete